MASSRPRGRLSATSEFLHVLDEATTKSGVAVAMAFTVFVALLAIGLTGFDIGLQAVFASVCSGVTVTMVFVLQHTQRRAQIAIQLKLDELVRALPQADNRMVKVETASSEELNRLENERQDIHDALRS